MVYGASPAKRRTNAELGEVNEAIVDAVRADYPVTLRGVYYRVVSLGAVEKTENGYRLVGRQLLKLRRNGVVPYSWITDGTRWITKPDTWSDVDEMLEDAASSYRRALWHDQNVEVHVFTEKDAISGAILPVTKRWDVPLGVIRGYTSESFAHSVAEAIKHCGKDTIYVYQLGNHDPSGVDAWRAFQETVAGFLGEKVTREMAARAAEIGVTLKPGTTLGVEEIDPDNDFPGDTAEQITYMFPHPTETEFPKVTFARLAVTEDQIEDWQLPTRPTKRSDSRSKSFTGGSVEVDAIPAGTLREIVEEAITAHVDQEQLRITRVAEDSEREILQNMLGGVSGDG